MLLESNLHNMDILIENTRTNLLTGLYFSFRTTQLYGFYIDFFNSTTCFGYQLQPSSGRNTSSRKE